MATKETALFAAQDLTRANPSRLASSNVGSGSVQFASIPYVMDGTEATSDLINLCKLPKDCIPLPQLSSVAMIGDPGTAFTIDVGTADNPDGMADAVDLKDGGDVKLTTSTGAPVWVSPTPLVADDTVDDNATLYATLTLVTTPATGVTLVFNIAYKLGR